MTLPKANWRHLPPPPTCVDCGRNMLRTVDGQPNPHDKCSACRPKRSWDRDYRRRLRWEKAGVDVDDPAAVARAELLEATKAQQLHVALAAELAAEGLVSATRLGHDVTHMDQDTEPAAWIGRCVTCEGFLAVDVYAAEIDLKHPLLWGVCDVPCPGESIHKDAERRLEESIEAATSSGSGEYADRGEYADSDAEIVDSRWRRRL